MLIANNLCIALSSLRDVKRTKNWPVISPQCAHLPCIAVIICMRMTKSHLLQLAWSKERAPADRHFVQSAIRSSSNRSQYNKHLPLQAC